MVLPLKIGFYSILMTSKDSGQIEEMLEKCVPDIFMALAAEFPERVGSVQGEVTRDSRHHTFRQHGRQKVFLQNRFYLEGPLINIIEYTQLLI